MPLRSLRPFVRSLVLLVPYGAACGDGGGDGDGAGVTSMMFDAPDETEGETEGAGPAFVPGEATDLCVDAPSVEEGVHYGTLRARQSDLGGTCGQGGPDAFFRLDVPRRSDIWLEARGVDFEPRVGVLPSTCVDAWSDRSLLCTEGLGGWLLDVAAGSRLVVSVGVGADDPAIVTAPGDDSADPLDFRLDVSFRDVLEVGEACLPTSRGRCGAGTGCLAASDTTSAVCTALAADTCATALPVEIDIGASELTIDRQVPQSDAHAHSCGGARHPERVFALSLPITDDPPTLTVRSDTPQVGLALRGSDCAPSGELSCAAPTTTAPAMTVEIPPDAGRPILLFVELPPPPATDAAAPPGEEAPISVVLELTTAG
jgi:hypothetical protein